jgi:hypothetical protein
LVTVPPSGASDGSPRACALRGRNVTVALFLAVLALGFAEGLVCRGVLLVGLRGTFREVGAWALSCLGPGTATSPTTRRRAGWLTGSTHRR